MSDELTLTVEDGGLAESDERTAKAEAILQAALRQVLTNSRLRMGPLMELAPAINSPVAAQLANLVQGLCQDVEDLVDIAVNANAFNADPGEAEATAAEYVRQEMIRHVQQHQKDQRKAIVQPPAPGLLLPPGVRRPD